MKILTGDTIRMADRITAQREGISSAELMEQAAELIAQWIGNHVEEGTPLLFVIGKGNNGGDGLAAARMLHRAGFPCRVCLTAGADELSPDCRLNLERLPEEVPVWVEYECDTQPDEVVIDALLGSGMRGAAHGQAAQWIARINALPNRIVSIDLPSGMQSEFENDPSLVVHADTTLTVAFPKLAMLLPEAGDCCGKIEVLPLELDTEFLQQSDTSYYYLTEAFVRSLLLPRPEFTHKGNAGHALLVCGSRRMMGAAVLATGSALRSGCGVVTSHVPDADRGTLLAHCPSAMLSLDPGASFTTLPENLNRYAAVGAGSGLGQAPETAAALEYLLDACHKMGKPMVLDADALNILAAKPACQRTIPAGSVLTPHPGELRRLVGTWNGEKEKLDRVRELAGRLASVVVVKGAHTMICLPDGRCFFNATGNPGMAKGGSGDVLTGLITGLLARGYTAPRAAVLGVWLHGAAGDKSRDYYGAEAMNSSDLSDFLGEAWMQIG